MRQSGSRRVRVGGKSAASRSVSYLSSLASSLPLLLSGRGGGSGSYARSFDSRRDLYSILGYRRDITISDCRTRYNRGGIAKRIVEVFPRAIWAKGGIIYENPDPNQITDYEQLVLELYSRLQVWNKFYRANILSRLGHYSILLIGAPGDLENELERGNGTPDQIAYIRPYAEDQAEIISYIEDEHSPLYGQPEYYRISFLDAKKQSKNPKVHWSRVIHFVDSPLESDLINLPCLSPVWNYLDDLDKLVGGGSEAAFRRMNPGMNLNIDPNLFADIEPEEMEQIEKEMDEQVAEYELGNSKTLRTYGTELKLLESGVQNFGLNSSAIIDLISGTLACPKRKLIGSERGELASNQDAEDFNARVDEFRTESAVPNTRKLNDRLIDYNYLPRPKNGEYFVEWEEIEELNEDQKASVLLKIAQANNFHSSATGEVLVTTNEAREYFAQLPPLENVEDGNSNDNNSGNNNDNDNNNSSNNNPDNLNVNSQITQTLHFNLTSSVKSFYPSAKKIIKSTLSGTDELFHVDILNENNSVLDVCLAQVERNLNSLAAKMGSLLLSVLNESGKSEVNRAKKHGWFVKRRGNSKNKNNSQQVNSQSSGHHSDNKLPGEFKLALSINKAKNHKNSANRAITLQSNKANVTVSFNTSSSSAVRWALNRAGELITEIKPDAIQAVRSFVSSAVGEGKTRVQLAKEIKTVIGFRSDQVEAINNLAHKIGNAEPGDIIKAGSRKIKIPQDITKVTDEWIQNKLDKYADDLLDSRSDLIARTELNQAANEGLIESWAQAIDAGDLPSDVKRMWIANTDRHQYLDGEVVGLDEEFSGGFEPGEEPNCGCAQGLVEG